MGFGARVKIPAGARIEVAKQGAVIDDGPKRGHPARVELWHGYASDGYKTGYAARPVRWFRIIVDSEIVGTWRFAGKRYDKGMDDYNKVSAGIA